MRPAARQVARDLVIASTFMITGKELLLLMHALGELDAEQAVLRCERRCESP